MTKRDGKPNRPRFDPETVRCGAVGSEGTQCGLAAGWDTDHLGSGPCRLHGGRAQRITQYHIKKQVADLREDLRSTLHGPIIKIDPRQALLEEVWRTAAIIGWLGDKVRNMSEDELQQRDNRGTAVPAFYVKLYETERMHMVRVAKAAVDAGVAERQVELAEEQGRMLAGVIRGVLTDRRLGLTAAQRQTAMGVTRELIMALPVGASMPGEETAVIDVNGDDEVIYATDRVPE